jgi:hypothetical protein
MSLQEVVDYESHEEVEKKSFVMKKAMAEVIAAKWMSIQKNDEVVVQSSEVKYLFDSKLGNLQPDQEVGTCQRNTGKCKDRKRNST